MAEAIEFRPCGECTACCDGHLSSIAHGNTFGKGKACVFLVKKVCSIYEDRPYVCRKYQCAWTQGLLPEWMRPDQTGVLVSVEDDSSGNKYLKLVEMKPFIEYEFYQEIDKFCKNNNTYYVRVDYEHRFT